MNTLLPPNWVDVKVVNTISQRISTLENTLGTASFQQLGECQSPDDLPLPSPYLVYLVTGQFNVHAFYNNGLLGIDSITKILTENGIDPSDLGSVLDFGCGCGRVLRHWRGTQIYGTDYNEKLVSWCREALPFAVVATNGSHPPLLYENATFDFVYAISVFTHLSRNLQVPWFEELARVIRPGGHLYITVHGESRLDSLNADHLGQFASGDLVVLAEEQAGTNSCAAFHPEEYVRGTFGEILEVVDFVPLGAADADQDVYLFVKR